MSFDSVMLFWMYAVVINLAFIPFTVVVTLIYVLITQYTTGHSVNYDANFGNNYNKLIGKLKQYQLIKSNMLASALIVVIPFYIPIKLGNFLMDLFNYGYLGAMKIIDHERLAKLDMIVANYEILNSTIKDRLDAIQESEKEAKAEKEEEHD